MSGLTLADLFRMESLGASPDRAANKSPSTPGSLRANGLNATPGSDAFAGRPSPSQRLVNSVIVLHMRGGPSQLDTWVMKPEAPMVFCGEFQPIPTSVPGLQICELPPMASIRPCWLMS
jgi:hypothetical protein